LAISNAIFLYVGIDELFILLPHL
ncbi:MAG: hypothetical protein PWP67_2248, partial [Clostridium butyricum]|nr:hypothetical protein [Clostridium butyricum]